MPTFVSNELKPNTKILLVLESPGDDEIEQGIPVVGRAGKRLWDTFHRYGIDRNQVSIANLYNKQPPNNSFDWIEENDKSTLEENIKVLKNHIVSNKYNIVLCLGAKSLYYLAGKSPVSAWRGSVFGLSNQKYAVTYHPSYILRDHTKLPIFDMDIGKFVEEAKFPELISRKRTYHTNPTPFDLHEWFKICISANLLSVDIENSKKTNQIFCVGFAISATESFCFPWDDVSSRTLIGELLSSTIPKIFHFGTSDYLKLLEQGYRVENYTHDTMILQHVMWPEFPRSLAYLTSAYTDLPYYKHQGKDEIPDDNKEWDVEKVGKDSLYVYNGKDCCGTFECWEKMIIELKEMGLENIYSQEISMLPLAHDIAKNGMLVDQPLRYKMLESAVVKWNNLQLILNGLIGCNFNVKSIKAPLILKDKFNVPLRHKWFKGKSRVTFDEDAVVSLLAWCTEKIESSVKLETKARYTIILEILKVVIEIREMRQLISNYLTTSISNDGRIRSVYKVASTETGRWAAECYVDNTGLNSQTFPRGSINIVDIDIDKIKMIQNLKEILEENADQT